MTVKSDIEIAQAATLKPIVEIAAKLEIEKDDIELYGNFKAKINYSLDSKLDDKKNGKLILVTAITPTPSGEGKTTTTIGLGDALSKIGKKTIIALREPSLGPVFGMKGGATGGGYAQVIPMEDINLHFTGDLHAIGAANNLLAALIDNHIFHGNSLCIDVRKITWKRCVDMNDRQLRNIVGGMGGKANGFPREDGFNITVASEIMAILCLSNNLDELKEKIGKIVIGYTREDKPVTAGDLKASGALSALLKDAFKPNLVQTLEHTPAFIHGGPFANIAHGCNSLIATKMALKLADYVVTEAGFGADLGAEKFIDIKCRKGNLKPSAVVIVATVKALKHHGGVAKDKLSTENLLALEMGLPNLLRHLENITVKFSLPCVVAINQFPTDTDAEISLIKKKCGQYGAKVSLSQVWEKGGDGGIALAEEVIALAEGSSGNFKYIYSGELSIKEKINAVVTNIYGGDGADYSAEALKEIDKLEELGFKNLPVCMAKTQFSFSDDPLKLGAPKGFRVNVKNVKVSAGAGFVVVLTGEIMTMPGLPKFPAAEKIDIDSSGKISGLS